MLADAAGVLAGPDIAEAEAHADDAEAEHEAGDDASDEAGWPSVEGAGAVAAVIDSDEDAETSDSWDDFEDDNVPLCRLTKGNSGHSPSRKKQRMSAV